MKRLVLLAVLAGFPAMAEDRIATWCGGGVTGGGGGRAIVADGGITAQRRGLAAGPVDETPLGRDEAAYRRWRAALERIGFATLRHHQPGNMSCTLAMETGGARHAVTWPGTTPPDTLPRAVRDVFLQLHGWAP